MAHSSLWPRRVLWLVLSALTAGLIFLVVATVLRVILGHSVWWFGGLLEGTLLIAAVGACSLPSLVAYALVMLHLAKRRRASLLVSLLIGGVFGLTSIMIVTWIVSGVSPPDVVDTTGGLMMGAIPALLFWHFVTRKERQMAERQALDAAAISAME
jgi:hypothetical protein